MADILTNKRKLDESNGSSEKRPRQGEMKNPNDWTCPNCDDHVYASRRTCRKCGTPRSLDEKPLVVTGLTDKVVSVDSLRNPNDWVCPTCSDHVYASRPSCRKCGSPRPFAHKVITPPPIKELRAGDWACQKCASHNFRTRFECRKCKAPRGMGFSATPQQFESQPSFGFNAPTFDQSFMNSAVQGYNVGAAANAAYGVAAPSQGYSAPGYGANPFSAAVPLPLGGRPGDWMCVKCSDHNYATRGVCRRCNTPKDGVGRAGDWKCPNCADLVYSTRNECRKCGTSKPEMLSVEGAQTRPGDWLCGKCGDLQYAYRVDCRKCGEPK